MTTKKIIEQMEKEFDERFPGDVTTMEEDGMHARITSSLYNRNSLKSFISSYTRKLIEAVAKEIIGEDGMTMSDRLGDQLAVLSKNALRTEQRLKVKEIISLIAN